jgi:hypothetical protein
MKPSANLWIKASYILWFQIYRCVQHICMRTCWSGCWRCEKHGQCLHTMKLKRQTILAKSSEAGESPVSPKMNQPWQPPPSERDSQDRHHAQDPEHARLTGATGREAHTRTSLLLHKRRLARPRWRSAHHARDWRWRQQQRQPKAPRKGDGRRR